jgi:arabinan endo-1,5-alpha-L-arabinosidase
MIIAPYAFIGHIGWQGTGHCSVFENNGQYYIAHQGRPAVNKFFMNLHVPRIVWTEDGWPFVSPERYAGIDPAPINPEDNPWQWECIKFVYTVVPGFAEAQTSADIQKAAIIILKNDGTINENPYDKWYFENQTLELKWSNGNIENVIVEKGRDWENKKETILFTGLNNLGTKIRGKKSH